MAVNKPIEIFLFFINPKSIRGLLVFFSHSRNAGISRILIPRQTTAQIIELGKSISTKRLALKIKVDKNAARRIDPR